jgi:hypothetical protein
MNYLKTTFCLLCCVLLPACGGGGGSSSPNNGNNTPPANRAPVATAGGNQSVTMGSVVSLSGSGADADGDSLSYTWSMQSQPSGAAVSLSSTDVANPSFTPSVAGTYVLQLVVNDGTVNSSASTVQITVNENSQPNPANTPPTANAGSAQTVTTGTQVNLSGLLSSDADDDTLTYRWEVLSQPSGSNINLANATLANISFTPTTSGNYAFGLVVNDGTADSAQSQVSVTVNAPPATNGRPFANAGDDLDGEVNVQVVVDGQSSSDPENDTIIYTWSLLSVPAGSTTSLLSTSAAVTGFTPDVAGEYQLQLIVNDGVNISLPDTVVVTVIPENLPPEADIAAVANPQVNQVVTLNGTNSSDPDAGSDDVLQFSWSIVSAPADSAVVLQNAATDIASFIPDQAGSYEIALTVIDARFGTDSETTTLVVTRVNNAPTANAGNPQTGLTGTTFTLDGTASADVDGDALSYAWSVVSQPAGEDVSISDAAAASPEVTLTAVGEYRFALTVDDGDASSAPAEVMITVATGNVAPIANAGHDQAVNTGADVVLSAQNSMDNDGDTITFTWRIISQPASSAVTLNDPTAVNQAFTVTHDGVYQLGLIANDGALDSAEDSVEVVATTDNALPIANAGVDVDATAGQLVTLDAGLSTDADNDALRYQWQLLSQPVGSDVSISAANSVTASFTPQQNGDYILQLIVNDGTGSSQPDTLVISVVQGNLSPIANAGSDQSVRVMDTVLLDANNSVDPDADVLTYRWSLVTVPAGSTASLSTAQNEQASFTADVAGTFVVALIVNDGAVDSQTDTVQITATNTNAVPIAVITSPQNLFTRELITLSATDSTDADADVLTVAWSVDAVPEGSSATLNNVNAITPSFIGDVPGSYVVSLTVNDGVADSSTVTQTLIVAEHIILQRQSDSFNATFDKVDFPFNNVKVALNWFGSQRDTFYTLDRFRITAQSRDFTISQLQFGFSNPNYVPFAFYDVDNVIVGMANGDVIAQGETVEFILASPLTDNQVADVVVRFVIAETGEEFRATYRYSASN